ncbi:hypothetical protein ACJJTC_009607 [Scirpophaga incertulas]
MPPKKNPAKTREEILEQKRIAERLRYQRLKNDPQKKEEMKEKERQKYQKKKEKGTRKLVQDMSRREHKAVKKTWKEHCTKYRAKKKNLKDITNTFIRENIPDSIDPPVECRAPLRSSVAARNKEANKKKLEKILKEKDHKIQEYKQKFEKYKKRLQRLKKQKTKQKVESLMIRLLDSLQNFKQKERKIKLKYYMPNASDFDKLQMNFRQYRLEMDPVNTINHDHAYQANSRILENMVLDDMLEYDGMLVSDNSAYDFVYGEVGADPKQIIKDKKYNVHCCCPVLSLQDTARKTKTDMFILDELRKAFIKRYDASNIVATVVNEIKSDRELEAKTFMSKVLDLCVKKISRSNTLANIRYAIYTKIGLKKLYTVEQLDIAQTYTFDEIITLVATNNDSIDNPLIKSVIEMDVTQSDAAPVNDNYSLGKISTVLSDITVNNSVDNYIKKKIF